MIKKENQALYSALRRSANRSAQATTAATYERVGQLRSRAGDGSQTYGVSRECLREDGSVADPQSLEAVDLEVRVDYSTGSLVTCRGGKRIRWSSKIIIRFILTNLGGRGWVIDRLRPLFDVRNELRIGRVVKVKLDRVAEVGRERLGPCDSASELETLDEDSDIALVGEVARVNEGRVKGVSTRDPDGTAREWAKNDRSDGEEVATPCRVGLLERGATEEKRSWPRAGQLRH